MTPPQIDRKISLGSALNLIVLVIGIAVSWGVMTERNSDMQGNIEGLSAALDKEGTERRASSNQLELRIRSLENDAARSSAQYDALLQILARIEARLERMENR